MHFFTGLRSLVSSMIHGRALRMCRRRRRRIFLFMGWVNLVIAS